MRLFRAGKYGGKIGIVLNAGHSYPTDPNSQADKDAAERNYVFMLKWYTEPLMLGDYPQILKDRVGSRLPKFTDAEKEMIKETLDFIAINYYMCHNVSEGDNSDKGKGYNADVNITIKDMHDPSWTSKTDMVRVGL